MPKEVRESTCINDLWNVNRILIHGSAFARPNCPQFKLIVYIHLQNTLKSAQQESEAKHEASQEQPYALLPQNP